MSLHPKIARSLVALAFATVVGGAAGLVFQYRDALFEWSWARPNGTVVAGGDTVLAVSARNYAEARRPGEACVVRLFAHDDHYLYGAEGCAKFADPLTGPSEGDITMVPSRWRYHGPEVSSWETPDRAFYENSVRRLFPKEVYVRLRDGVARSEYWAAGMLRAKEKAGPPDGAPH